jgi:hypothetical protein
MGRWYSSSPKESAINVAKENIQLADLMMNNPAKEAGWDFAFSVKDKSLAIISTLDSKPESYQATYGQMEALRKINSGLRKWFKEEELDGFN